MFWYILGYDYEVFVFSDKEKAERALADLHEEADDDTYFKLFEGVYGTEFSGWIGNHK